MAGDLRWIADGGHPVNDLGGLLGGQGGALGQLGGLVSAFEQGQHDQVPDQQVQQGYSQVAASLPQDQYVQAAEQALSRLSPDQRQQLAGELQAQAQAHGVNVPAVQQRPPTDPGGLANAMGQVHAGQPNVLQQMFAPGGTFSSPIAKAALLGITAFAAKQLTTGR
jgi:hypothetical protein